MLNDERRAYLELHLAVFLFGFTAILGDLIQLTALVLVWWRVLITSFSLAPFVRLRDLWRRFPRRRLLRFAGIGLLVGLHWLAFYGSIKLANASISLVCMATTSFFTALLEPLIVKRPFRWYELALGVFIVPGMVLIVNNVAFGMLPGVWVGLAAAFLAALFATLNKRYIGESDPLRITFIELGSACLFLGVIILVMRALNLPLDTFWPPRPIDWGYLLVLALACTTLAYVLSLRALRHLTAFAANLTINLEPVYGIALAWIILGENEELNVGFYIGVVIILMSVFSYPLLRRRF